MSAGFGNKIKKLVSSNFMGMMRSVSLIFDTRSSYLCSSNRVNFVELVENKSPRNIKVVSKVLEVTAFIIVDYFSRVKVYI